MWNQKEYWWLYLAGIHATLEFARLTGTRVTLMQLGLPAVPALATPLFAAADRWVRIWSYLRPPRRHIFWLVSQAGILGRDGCLVARIQNANLRAKSQNPQYPAGWTVFLYEIARKPDQIILRLSADVGQGYEPRHSWVMPGPQSGQGCRAILLPSRPIGLRFETSTSGEIQLAKVRAWACGTLWLAMLVIWRAYRATPRMPGLRYAVGGLLRYLRPARWGKLKTKLMHRSGLFGDEFTAYERWTQRYTRLDQPTRSALCAALDRVADGPKFSVIMPVYKTPPALLAAAIESVRRQIYARWELCIVDDGSCSLATSAMLKSCAAHDHRVKVRVLNRNAGIAAASNAALALATGDYVAFLDHDDELAEHALLAIAAEIMLWPEAEIIYSDEDKIDLNGNRYDPFFKPDWNPDLFYAQYYLNHLTVYRRSLVEVAGAFRQGFDGSQDYDLALRALEHVNDPTRIRHVPHVLYHWRASVGSTALAPSEKPDSHARGMRALQDHLDRLGSGATTTTAATDYYRVCWPVPAQPPLVTLIIPTRNRSDLLRRCVHGIREITDYASWELIVVDNGSDDQETMRYLALLSQDPRIRVLRMDEAFNFSALNNRAAAVANGSLLGFLNNDLGMIEPGWLTEMVSQALRPGVGAVGAKLLYRNRTIQHAGVVLGMGGVAGHVHRFAPADGAGYFSHAQLTQNVSAVTAACMLMPKAIFEQVGGFDATNLAVAFNDVDLCLRIRAAGYRIVWTPFAVLFHFESATRGYDDTADKIEVFVRECDYMRKRWVHKLTQDPYFNPNLSLEQESPALAFPPRLAPLGSDWLSILQNRV